ncbi:MAG: hypothetical protein JWQ78_2255 [Sediminibacterium sp.]|nr:hypothetical protein [Sediminibacterium sp.]
MRMMGDVLLHRLFHKNEAWDDEPERVSIFFATDCTDVHRLDRWD